MALSGEAPMRFILAVFATWRVTHLLANEDGPADVIFRVRRWLGRNPIGGLMDCFNCLSFWVAAPAALFVAMQPLTWVAAWLALSGAACLLERLGPTPATDFQLQPNGEDDHVLR